MSPRTWTAALALLLAAASPRALDVVLAPLAVQDEGRPRAAPLRPDSDLLAALTRLRPGDPPLVRRMNPASDDPPRSLLEAARLCEAHAYPYLLYGYLKRTAYAYQAEVKLFDREAGAIAAVFFGSDDPGHYERLVGDVASKILAYFEHETGLGPERRLEPRSSAVRVVCSLGAWLPISRDWDRVSVGYGTVGLGGRFVPARTLSVAGLRASPVLGLDLEYSLAANEAGYESFFMHAVRVRVPVALSLEVFRGHSFGIGVGPLLAIDTIAQDRLYADLKVETSVAAGLSLLGTYRYAVSARSAIGLASALDLVGYESPQLTWSPRLFADFRLGPTGKEASGE
jgi:hypothetical protein